MKFSIIGTGFIFPRHIEAIKSIGGEIIDIVNEYSDWKAMVENTKADCIVILTPNDLHYPMVRKAIEQNKIILCEKPFVINSRQAELLAQQSDQVFVVLQLRHHPLAKELKKNISKTEKYYIGMDISVHRDPEYFKSWKGQKERSGGMLFNLGIHFFDLLLYLFGEAKESSLSYCDEKIAIGWIKGDNYLCDWRMTLLAERNRQRRTFIVNGKPYNFSSLDNLSYEGLHKFIYQDLLKGKGVQTKDTIKVIKLIEQLYGKKEV